MKTLLIGLGYKARNGKDTLAQKIHNLIPESSKIYSFAAALKAYCRVSGWMTAKDGRILQLVGTDIVRSAKPNIWVDCLKYQIDEEKPKIALIPDMRFKNELAFVKDNGGITICVRRQLPDGSFYVADDRPADHASEIDLDGAAFDYNFNILDGDLQIFDSIAQSFVKLITARAAQE